MIPLVFCIRTGTAYGISYAICMFYERSGMYIFSIGTNEVETNEILLRRNLCGPKLILIKKNGSYLLKFWKATISFNYVFYSIS